MSDVRQPKKSETIEIRVAFATKQAFMARCRSAGSSASDVLRSFIGDYVDGRAPAAGKAAAPLHFGPSKRLGAAAAAAALLSAGAIAGPSLARPSAPATFARLDTDHDGRLSFAEFSRAASVRVTLAGSAAEPVADRDLGRALVRAEFDRLDADRNGEISLSEFQRVFAGRR